MKKVEFTKELATGNAIIDAQHKALIDSANALAEAVEKRVGLDAAVETVQFLVEYTMFHFAGEEKYMQENNYPDFEAHKALHNEFTNTVNKLYSDLMLGGRNNFELLDRLQGEISDWLVNHIMGTDVKMITWVKEQKA